MNIMFRLHSLIVGCGVGDISVHVASRGWHGKAIDFSSVAIEKAKSNLSSFESVKVEKQSLFLEQGSYNAIFLLDVLEHIQNDVEALDKISSLLSVNGHAIIIVPSNPREWRWDDEFYGHFRRYTVEEIKSKLLNSGLEPLVVWDFTYPFFWMLRRIYTGIKFIRKDINRDKVHATTASSTVNAWQIPLFSSLLSQRSFFWKLIYKMQFKYFRDKPAKGYEMMILAKKGTGAAAPVDYQQPV